MEIERIEVDFEDLTLGELEDIEEMSGVVMANVGGNPPAKVLTAAACVLMRRTTPDFTLEDARAIRVKALNFGGTTGEEEAPDPTPSPAGSGDG